VTVDDEGEAHADGGALVSDVQLEGLTIEAGADVSVAAWIVERLGHLARPGDVVDLGGWEAVVVDVRARRVRKVRFRPKRAEISDPPPAPPSLPVPTS
jgi:putative hemolysin